MFAIKRFQFSNPMHSWLNYLLLHNIMHNITYKWACGLRPQDCRRKWGDGRGSGSGSTAFIVNRKHLGWRLRGAEFERFAEIEGQMSTSRLRRASDRPDSPWAARDAHRFDVPDAYSDRAATSRSVRARCGPAGAAQGASGAQMEVAVAFA